MQDKDGWSLDASGQAGQGAKSCGDNARCLPSNIPRSDVLIYARGKHIEKLSTIHRHLVNDKLKQPKHDVLGLMIPN